MINNQSIVDELAGNFGDKITAFDEPFGLLTFHTNKESLIEIISFLKNSDTLKFTFLTDITAIHLPDLEGSEFGVIYHLHSLENNIRVRIKVFLPKEDITIPTLIPLFEGANWMERETFDFYGVLFEGHPNLKRILNLDEMDYHPLRKEYPLEDATRNDKIDALFGR